MRHPLKQSIGLVVVLIAVGFWAASGAGAAAPTQETPNMPPPKPRVVLDPRACTVTGAMSWRAEYVLEVGVELYDVTNGQELLDSSYVESPHGHGTITVTVDGETGHDYAVWGYYEGHPGGGDWSHTATLKCR